MCIYFFFLNNIINKTGSKTISAKSATSKVKQVSKPNKRILSKSDKTRLTKPPNKIKVVKKTGLPVSA